VAGMIALSGLACGRSGESHAGSSGGSVLTKLRTRKGNRLEKMNMNVLREWMGDIRSEVTYCSS
jgi:hypothetical protein